MRMSHGFQWFQHTDIHPDRGAEQKEGGKLHVCFPTRATLCCSPKGGGGGGRGGIYRRRHKNERVESTLPGG